LNESVAIVPDTQISGFLGDFGQLVQRIIQMGVKADMAQISIIKRGDSVPKTALATIEAVHITLSRQGVDQVMGRAGV
jgi:hypothetical protein